MGIRGIHHVQIAIAPGGEDLARRFYGGLLEMPEIGKPQSLSARGGVWFQCGAQQLHRGIELPVARSRRHPGFLTAGLDRLRARLEEAGFRIGEEPELPGFRRIFTKDPFGNRLELLEAL